MAGPTTRFALASNHLFVVFVDGRLKIGTGQLNYPPNATIDKVKSGHLRTCVSGRVARHPPLHVAKRALGIPGDHDRADIPGHLRSSL